MTGLSMQGIVGRRTENGHVVRTLECGHEQNERPGGNAPYATHAKCATCRAAATPKTSGAPAPAGSSCAAIVVPLNERRMRVCGQAASVLTARGPRCLTCARKVRT